MSPANPSLGGTRPLYPTMRMYSDGEKLLSAAPLILVDMINT